MDSSGVFSFRYVRLGLIGILVAGGAWTGSSPYGQADSGARNVVLQTPAIPPLSADDVSLLFPAPTREEDFAKLIAVRDLTTQDQIRRNATLSGQTRCLSNLSRSPTARRGRLRAQRLELAYPSKLNP